MKTFVETRSRPTGTRRASGADGVVTGTGLIWGRLVAPMANDPTVKAGSWGPEVVEKILRIQERPEAGDPMIYLVDRPGPGSRSGPDVPRAAAERAGSSTTK